MDPGVTSGLLAATFTASFVEFVEALTIVLAMGMTRSWRSTMVGVAAAVVALVAFTAGVGYALTAWLPKALLQLLVGSLLLATFGTFWSVEGLGIVRPAGRAWNGPAAISPSSRCWSSGSCSAARWCVPSPPRTARHRCRGRRRAPRSRRRCDVGATPSATASLLRGVKGFARFWYDFVIGDDWKIAAAVAAVLLAGAALVASAVLPDGAAAALTGAGLLTAFTAALVADVRRHHGE